MIDLGVMTPPEVIIEKIKEIQPDIVCLSGLITPSLEEMSIVAREMEKAGFTMPLLIGGATTSKLHTAIKIAPNYNSGSVVYVKDASQAPAVVAKLVNPTAREEYIQGVKEEYILLSENQKDRRRLASIPRSEEKSYKIDWTKYTPIVPSSKGKTGL